MLLELNSMRANEDDRELIKRAIAAYARRGGTLLPGKESSVVTLRRRKCVVLRNGSRVLAVYMREYDGSLSDIGALR